MVDRLKVLDCQSTCLGRPSSLGGLGFLPRKRFRPGLSRPGEVKDVYVHWVLRLILRWDPLGNWAISTFSGQNPCTRVISSILHSFLRLSNKLYEITPKERFLWEPEKIYFKSFQLNKTKFYTWLFYLCFNSCEIWNQFPGLPWEIVFGVIT